MMFNKFRRHIRFANEMKQSSKKHYYLAMSIAIWIWISFIHTHSIDNSNATETGEAGDETSGIKWNRGNALAQTIMIILLDQQCFR